MKCIWELLCTEGDPQCLLFHICGRNGASESKIRSWTVRSVLTPSCTTVTITSFVMAHVRSTFLNSVCSMRRSCLWNFKNYHLCSSFKTGNRLTGFLWTLLECLMFHQSDVHSQTLPTMLCKPYLLGGYEFTGAVERYPSSMVFSPGNLPCHMLVLQLSFS